MKGRLYDPLLRRFITSDPFVTDPLNPQGMNRYAYVQNNPLMFTDPSGFWGSENPNPSEPPNVQPIPPSVNIPALQITEFGGVGVPPAHVPTAQGQGYMVPPSTPPPGGGADIASARAEAANQAAQMQQMGQIASYEGSARVANSSAGNSAFNPAPVSVTDKPSGVPSSDPGGYKLPRPDVPMDVPGGPRDSNHVGSPAVPIAVLVALCLADEECLAFAVAATFMASIGIVKAVESLVESAPNLVDSLTNSLNMAKATTPNQLQEQVSRKQAPRGVERVDKGDSKQNEKPHVHLRDGRALNNDGTWKHGSGSVDRAVSDGLIKNGWSPPK